MNVNSKINKRINREIHNLLYDTTNYLYVNGESIAFVQDVDDVDGEGMVCNEHICVNVRTTRRINM